MAYHRVKQMRQGMCPECLDESGREEKTCYWCQKRYTDEHGIVRSLDEQAATLKGAFGKKDEVSEEAVKSKLEQLTKAGVKILPNPGEQNEHSN
jgi:hypothetical protein